MSESEGPMHPGQDLPARPEHQPYFTPPSPAPSAPPAPIAPRKSSLPFDPRRIVPALKQAKGRILLVACIAAAIGLFCGYRWSNYYLKVTFILQSPGEAAASGPGGETAKQRLLTAPTLVKLMQSTELMQRVAAEAQPPVSAAALAGRLSVQQEREEDLVSASIAGQNASDLVKLATVYAQEATQMGKDLQTAETHQMNEYYKGRIASTETEMAAANDEMVRFQKDSQVLDLETEAQAYMKEYADLLAKADTARTEAGTLDTQITALQGELARQSPAAQKLAAAKSRLEDLLGRYTEAHPSVIAERKEIAELEQQLAESNASPVTQTSFADNSIGSALYLRLVELEDRKRALETQTANVEKLKADLQDKVNELSEKGVQYALIKTRLESLKNTHAMLMERQRDAQLYEENAQGYFRAFALPGVADIDARERMMKGLWMALAGLGIGCVGMGTVVVLREVTDDRLKTAADVERVTGLPVLAGLGDLDAMSPKEREQWAFRTWTALSGQLNASANHGMVCGFISSGHSEGRSTWIKLLANAATQRGLRVMAVSANGPEAGHESKTAQASAPSASDSTHTRGPQMELELPATMASLEDVTRSVAQVGAPLAHLPLSGWVWNLERRKQWQNALAEWKRADDLVLLIELPPASTPEAVLLAENLPQVIWLADSGKSRTRETRQQLETLRHAKCRLACAVLNHQPDADL